MSPHPFWWLVRLLSKADETVTYRGYDAAYDRALYPRRAREDEGHTADCTPANCSGYVPIKPLHRVEPGTITYVEEPQAYGILREGFNLVDQITVHLRQTPDQRESRREAVLGVLSISQELRVRLSIDEILNDLLVQVADGCVEGIDCLLYRILPILKSRLRYDYRVHPHLYATTDGGLSWFALDEEHGYTKSSDHT